MVTFVRPIQWNQKVLKIKKEIKKLVKLWEFQKKPASTLKTVRKVEKRKKTTLQISNKKTIVCKKK